MQDGPIIDKKQMQEYDNNTSNSLTSLGKSRLSGFYLEVR